MRQAAPLVLALLTAALAGCFTGRGERSLARGDAGGPFEGPTGDDVVQLHVAVVERPRGDGFLNHGLWELGDEQGVNLERKPVLEDNGLRVGLVGGLPPAGLQALLSSPRSCPDPRLVRGHAGQPAPVLLGRAWPRCDYRLVRDGRETEVSLQDAQCLLEVVPTLAEEGRVTLRFTPHVHHGQASHGPAAAQEASGALRWELESRRPDEAYPWLGWELTVGPGEYVVVGARLDRPGTLGERFFVPDKGSEAPVQRLLVLRASRAPSGPAPGASVRRSPPLALQAAWSSARGQAP